MVPLLFLVVHNDLWTQLQKAGDHGSPAFLRLSIMIYGHSPKQQGTMVPLFLWLSIMIYGHSPTKQGTMVPLPFVVVHSSLVCFFVSYTNKA